MATLNKPVLYRSLLKKALIGSKNEWESIKKDKKCPRMAKLVTANLKEGNLR